MPKQSPQRGSSNAVIYGPGDTSAHSYIPDAITWSERQLQSAGSGPFHFMTAIAVAQRTGRGAKSYLDLRLNNRAARFGLADDVSLPSEFAMDKAVPGTSAR